MPLKQRLAALLDRPGTRWLLAALATRQARQATSRDVTVAYDDAVWTRTLRDEFTIADDAAFNYYATGMRFFAQAFDDSRDYWFHLYKPQPGDVIVDVGAGIGVDTLVFSRAVGSAGRVLAVEAHPHTFAKLQHNCHINHARNATCIHAAVVDQAREMFIESQESDELNTTAATPTAEHSIAVTGRSLDDICREHGINRVDFLKMNIEGGESLAIHGMAETIQKVRHICIASHDFRSPTNPSDVFSTREAVETFLTQHGFRIVNRLDDRRSYVRDHVHGVRTS